MELVLTWDDENVQKLIREVVLNCRDMSPVMFDFAEYMMNETMERFDREEAPDGTGWQELSDVTKALREKAGKSGKILQQDGILRNSIHPDYDQNSAGLSVDGSNLEYAAIHNLGGKAGRGRKVTIPAREYLGFNEADIEYFKESVAGWVVTGKVG